METTTLAPGNGSTPTTPATKNLGLDSKNRQWEFLLARLGKRYANAKLSNFEATKTGQKLVKEEVTSYLSDFKTRWKAGQNVLFFGPPGTGKDHLMVAMMRVAIQVPLRVCWSDGAEMFSAFRDSIRGDASESQLFDRYSKADILAISDPVPPFGGLTPYQSSMFFRIIDRRYRDLKPTWITINCKDRKEAEDRLGTSIVDRLGEGALTLPCSWHSYRQDNTSEEISAHKK